MANSPVMISPQPALVANGVDSLPSAASSRNRTPPTRAMFTAVYATMIAFLVGAAQTGVRQKLITLLAATLGGVGIVTIAAFGGFAAGPIGPLAPPVFAFSAMMALLFGGWFIVPAFRRALLSVPLPALIALPAMAPI